MTIILFHSSMWNNAWFTQNLLLGYTFINFTTNVHYNTVVKMDAVKKEFVRNKCFVHHCNFHLCISDILSHIKELILQ